MNPEEELTFEEREALRELRRITNDELPPDLKNDKSLYLRFLRARDFNVNKSEEMLRNNITWRKTYQIEKIEKNYKIPEVAAKYIPLTRIGFDKGGSPIRYFAFGNMDSRGLLKSIRKMDIVKTIICFFEADAKILQEQSEKLQKRIDQWVYIFNYEHYTFASATHKLTLETLMSLFRTYEANYPERLKAAYVINSSAYFNLMFNIIKPLLSGATRRKIFILGKDNWEGELLKNIDAEVLPAFLGGNRTDPDGNPKCNTILNHGGLVPEEYFTAKSGKRLSQKPGIKKLTVSRMSLAQVAVEVAAAGSSIEWEFETQSKDIGFGLVFKEDGKSKGEQLIPTQRIDTHVCSEVGLFQCERPGIYILMFDNSFSWINQKEIYCSATVVTPDGQRITVLQ